MFAEKCKPFLLYAYAVPFFCWAFDVFTTYHAIASRIAVENNPLGWPLGIVGALLFYVPALVFCYLLLFRFRGGLAGFSAVLITALALFLGVMNLGAGLHNLQIVKM